MTERASLLWVDDDRDEVDVALRALRRTGLDATVEVARDGQEALQALRLETGREGEPVSPRVVFLDLKMPRVDGWEVLRRLRAHPPTADLPVVVISSSDRERDVEQCYELGANSVLVKRHDARSPGAYLAQAVRYWLELNQPTPRRAHVAGRARAARREERCSMADPIALVVEDDEDFRASVVALVEREGFATREAPTLEAARRALEVGATDVVLLDLSLPDGEGLELIDDEAEAQRPEFVVMTGHTDAESAIAALRAGALDYLAKPVDRARLRTILTNVARTRGLKREVDALRRELRDLGRFGSMVGRSKPMHEVYDLIARVAPTQSSVFITGESGTGKELVAETVHRLSARRDGPYIALNCGSVSATLIESELFGHEKGSFTGADRRRRGYFEEASGGTLFLDEITEMPIA